MLMPLPDGQPTPLDAQSGSQRNATFSPDGRWIAYDEANDQEQPQVYVRSLAGSRARIQVSMNGGTQPRWTRAGRELVYRRGDVMVAVSFDPATGSVGSPTQLFRVPDAGQLDNRTPGYDVTPDGSRFLLVTPVARPDVQPMHVITNWFDVLRARMSQ